jgi:hypothetical protein
MAGEWGQAAQAHTIAGYRLLADTAACSSASAGLLLPCAAGSTKSCLQEVCKGSLDDKLLSGTLPLGYHPDCAAARRTIPAAAAYNAVASTCIAPAAACWAHCVVCPTAIACGLSYACIHSQHCHKHGAGKTWQQLRAEQQFAATSH